MSGRAGRAWVLLAGCLLAACGAGEPERGSGKEAEPEVVDLAVERTSTFLKPSEVQTARIAVGTGSGATAPAGQQVESSRITQVQQILTEFNARHTAEGVVIDLPESILFDFDQAALRTDADTPLEKIAQVLREGYPAAKIAIYGHTDSKGDDAYNRRLSEARATAVRDALVTRFSVDAARLDATGLGESRPVAPNANPDGTDNPEGRQKNRRVEVLIRGAT